MFKYMLSGYKTKFRRPSCQLGAVKDGCHTDTVDVGYHIGDNWQRNEWSKRSDVAILIY